MCQMERETGLQKLISLHVSWCEIAHLYANMSPNQLCMLITCLLNCQLALVPMRGQKKMRHQFHLSNPLILFLQHVSAIL